MTQPSEDIGAAWRALQLGDGVREFSLPTLRLGVDAGYGPVRVAISPNGLLQLLVPTTAGRPIPVELSGEGIIVRPAEYVVQTRTLPFIEVTCGAKELQEVFKSLASDILRRLELGRGPEGSVIDAVHQFRDLLRQSRAWPVEKMVGLAGELTFLLQLLSTNPVAARAWTGPFGQRFDFMGKSVCVEVKSTVSRNSDVVSIHGIDQLEQPSDGRQLWLRHMVFERAGSGGKSIQDLIEAARSVSTEAHVIDSALSALGVADWRSISTLKDERLALLRETTYNVQADFPRLSLASFRPGHPVNGISDICYAIDLQIAADFRVPAAEVGARISELAGVAE